MEMGTSVELLNVIVATPRPVKMLAGRLPVAVFIPMTTGNGPVPLGLLIVEVNVIDAAVLRRDDRERVARQGGGQRCSEARPSAPIPSAASAP